MYATVSQADEYVKQYYSSTNSLRVAWEMLSNEDKNSLLNRAEQSIDGLPLKGRSLESGKAFPRSPFQEISMQRAMIATTELALASLDAEAAERLNLRRQGVKSYKIGDLSETFQESAGGLDSATHTLSIVAPFLSDWLGGGYQICPTRIKK